MTFKLDLDRGGKYLGLTAEEVDAARVRLTYRGARRLTACSSGLTHWYDKYHMKTLAIDLKFYWDFQYYVPRGFIVGIIRRHINSICYLRRFQTSKVAPHETIRWLKACIIWACGNLER